MARMPEAVWQGAHHDNGVMSRFDVLCLHTIVGWAPAHAAHFSTRANGEILQSRDTAYRSAANLNGNHRVIAVENEDHGAAFGSWSSSNVPAYTPQQIEALAKIAVWANKTHGIPLVACPDSKPSSRGIAFHRQGCDGNYTNGRVAGGELWSSARGKVCPGDRRISQHAQIINRARQIAGLEPGGGDEDLSLNAKQNQILEELHQALISGTFDQYHDGKFARISNDLGHLKNENKKEIDALTAKVNALSAKLDNVVAPDVDEVKLAAELKRLGIIGITAQEVQAAVTAANKVQWSK